MSADIPILVSVNGISGYPSVSDYSDWTVTASWSSSSVTFEATMGMCMPFVQFTKGSSDTATVEVNIGTVTIMDDVLVVSNSLSGSAFAVYGSAGSTWVNSGNTYSSEMNGAQYFSIALLPSGDPVTNATAFKKYAYTRPTDTRVDWAQSAPTSIVQTTFTVSTSDTSDSASHEGNSGSFLMGLLPHQYNNLGNTLQFTPQTQQTVRGLMKMTETTSFTVSNSFKGVLPSLPYSAPLSPSFSLDLLKAKIDSVKDTPLDTWTDSYNDGLNMNALMQTAKVAAAIGYTGASSQLLSTVQTRLEDWLTATESKNAFLFSQNSTWNTLIGQPAGYESDSNLNDHHFHQGYFVSMAAGVEMLNPGWGKDWEGMVELLIRDAANWDRTDTRFPFLRNFNPYAGHSQATGILNNEPHGNNQESSSESMNFSYALINWGTAISNNTIRDLGIYLYSTEQTAISEQYFNAAGTNFAPTYSRVMASRIWNDGYDAATFWTQDIAAMQGIELFPMTGGSLYLSQNTALVNKVWADMTKNTDVLKNVPNANLWQDVQWKQLAMVDAASAIELQNSQPGYQVKIGNSDATTQQWLHCLNGLGSVQVEITADQPMAMVFKNGNVLTQTGQNQTDSELEVTFSDGHKMVLPKADFSLNQELMEVESITM